MYCYSEPQSIPTSVVSRGLRKKTSSFYVRKKQKQAVSNKTLPVFKHAFKPAFQLSILQNATFTSDPLFTYEAVPMFWKVLLFTTNLHSNFTTDPLSNLRPHTSE